MGIGPWIIFFVVAGIALIIGKSWEETKKQEQASIKGAFIEYLGGSPHINVASRGNLKPTQDGLSFIYEGHDSYIDTPWRDIKSVELKTHEQITSDVTAGRLLLLGAFALAAKKQTVHTAQYLVVNCEEEGVPYNMVFSGSNIGSLVSRINYALIAHRKANKELPD